MSTNTAAVATYSLTRGQQQAITEAMDWLKTGHTGMRVFKGAAGTGKTLAMEHLLREFIGQDLCNGLTVACAPTKSAVQTLKKATVNFPYDSYLTTHSFLGLRKVRFKWTTADEEKLTSLLAQQKDNSQLDYTIANLINIRNIVEQDKLVLAPAEAKEGLGEVRLVIVDECSMVNKELFGYFVQMVETREWLGVSLHPNLQVIFVGDPYQLNPVEECTSPTFNVPSFTPLVDVVRYAGPILRLATNIREGCDLKTLVKQVPDDCLEIIPMDTQTAIFQAVQTLKDGETIRFISGTNARVHQLNQNVVSRLKNNIRPDYEPGDILLTRSSVIRGVFNGKPVAKAPDGVILCGTSTLLKVVNVFDTGDTIKGPSGIEYPRRELECVFAENDEPLQAAILAVPAYLTEQWEADIKAAYAALKAFSSASVKHPRGQQGKAAKEVWKQLGLKDWFTDLNGNPVSDREYKRYRNQYKIAATALYRWADNVSFSYASTVHSCQGQSLPFVIVDYSRIVNTPYSEEGGTWDVRKLLYTAITRATEQVVLLID